MRVLELLRDILDAFATGSGNGWRWWWSGRSPPRIQRFMHVAQTVLEVRSKPRPRKRGIRRPYIPGPLNTSRLRAKQRGQGRCQTSVATIRGRKAPVQWNLVRFSGITCVKWGC